jgi:DNA-binding transcriptional MerR regulator
VVILDSDFIKISTLAKRSGLSVQTLRFYKHQGLSLPAKRSDAGYRLHQQYVFLKATSVNPQAYSTIPYL